LKNINKENLISISFTLLFSIIPFFVYLERYWLLLILALIITTIAMVYYEQLFAKPTSDSWLEYISKKSLLFLILITILGVALRLYGLGFQNLYSDESATFIIAKQILEQGYTDYPRAKAYSYLVALSIKLFGKNAFALRLPSVLVGTITIPAIYWCGFKLFKDKIVGLIAAFLLAINAWHIAMSQASRMYILFGLTFLILITLIVIIIRKVFFANNFKKFIKNNLVYFFIIAGLFYFSYNVHVVTLEAVVFVAISFLFYFKKLYKKHPKVIKKYLIAVTFLTMIGIIVLLFTPSLRDKITYFSFMENIKIKYLEILVVYSGYSLLLLSGIFFSLVRQKSKKSVFFLILITSTLSLLLIKIFFIDHYFARRYIFHLLPILVIATAYSFILTVSVFKRYKKILIISILLGSMIYNGALLFSVYQIESGYLFFDTYAENYKDVFNDIEVKPTDGLIGTSRSKLEFYQNDTDNIQRYHYQMWKEEVWTFDRWKTDQEEYQDFINFISKHDHGYYIADHRRFYKWKKKVPLKIKFYILENMREVPTESDDVSVFEWGD
jgi:hypothetical protein